MKPLFDDTRPEAEAVLIDLLRRAPPWHWPASVSATPKRAQRNCAGAWPICFWVRTWQQKSTARCRQTRYPPNPVKGRV